MSTYQVGGYSSGSYTTLLTAEANDGANYVELSGQSVIDTSSGAVTDWVNQNGTDLTVNFASVGPAIAAAQAKGFNVMLKPQIAAYDPALAPITGSDYSNLVDANLVIANPQAFFAGYKAYILKWATLAQQYNVPILSIGNEMLAATKPQYTPYWNDIIDSIRQVYSGKLTYAALLPVNFADTQNSEVAQIQFWKKLDFAGFDVYPSLTKVTDPSVAALNAGWQQGDSQALAALAGQIGLPVIFTESGVATFAGANDRADYPDSTMTSAKPDYSEQANWYQSFFQTWAVNKPSWLQGVFLWDNDPGNLQTNGSYSNPASYDIAFKPAESVVASYYGGTVYASAFQPVITGSASNDRIALFGASGTAVGAKNAAATYTSQVSFSIDGTIINGVTPTLHFYVNGIDLGAKTLAATHSANGYVNPQGIPYTDPQTLVFTVPGLSVSQIKIVVETPVLQSNGVYESFTIHSASVNNFSLTDATLLRSNGNSNSGSAKNDPNKNIIGVSVDPTTAAATITLDPTPYQVQKQAGSASLPFQVTGGGGSDTVSVLGAPANYSINGVGSPSVTLTENAGLNQNAILSGIATIAFGDGAVLNTQTGAWSIAASGAVASASFNDYLALAKSGTVSAFALNDQQTPTLALTGSQYLAGTSLLAEIPTPYSLALTADAPNQSLTVPVSAATKVIFLQNASHYTISPQGDGMTVTVATQGSTDNVVNALQLQFADRTITLAASNSAAQAMALLYQGALGRTPDATGLAFWNKVTSLLPTNMPITNALADAPIAGGPSIAANFTGSPEFVAKYGTLTDSQFVTQLYANVLDRTPDSGGLSFWTNGITNHLVNRQETLVDFAESPEALANATKGFTGQSGAHAAWLVLI